jgi:hypothetical protein
MSQPGHKDAENYCFVVQGKLRGFARTHQSIPGWGVSQPGCGLVGSSERSAAAQTKALARAQASAERMCRDFEAGTSYRYRSAKPRAESWSCDSKGARTRCGFERARAAARAANSSRIRSEVVAGSGMKNTEGQERYHRPTGASIESLL